MTTQLSQITDQKVEAELDSLTYCAYLLTLNPALAMSVVRAAIDAGLEEASTQPGLLRRTVELSLRQLKREFPVGWDGESSAYEMALYGHPEVSDSKPFLEWKKDMIGNPIFLLDATSRIAFVLHNMLGYKVKEAAGMVQISEKEYRVQLRKAYMQLLSLQVSPDLAGDVLGQTALA
jgi:hypothetical protein